jgi:hypothetical protein
MTPWVTSPGLREPGISLSSLSLLASWQLLLYKEFFEGFVVTPGPEAQINMDSTYSKRKH